MALEMSYEHAQIRMSEIYRDPKYLDGSPLDKEIFRRELRDIFVILSGDEVIYVHGGEHETFQHGFSDDAA